MSWLLTAIVRGACSTRETRAPGKLLPSEMTGDGSLTLERGLGVVYVHQGYVCLY